MRGRFLVSQHGSDWKLDKPKPTPKPKPKPTPKPEPRPKRSIPDDVPGKIMPIEPWTKPPKK